MAISACTAAPRSTRALHPPAPFERAAALQAPREDRGTELLQYPTGLPLETLQAVARGLTHLPAEVTPHPEIQKLMARRRAMVEGTDSRVDFSFAEMLAFSTLALRRPPGAAPLLLAAPAAASAPHWCTADAASDGGPQRLLFAAPAAMWVRVDAPGMRSLCSGCR